MVLLLLMCRHLHHCCNGAALIMMALLPLLICRHLRCCQASIITLVTCCQAGVIALIVMALLLSMCRHLCHCCDCDCHPHDNGIIAVVDV
jgi:hypothetical protein